MSPPDAPGAEDDNGSESTPLDKIATALAASFAAVTAILGALGAKEGGLDKLLRNNPDKGTWAFGSIVAAIGLAGIARSALVPREKWQRIMLLVGSSLFAAGLFFATLLAVKTPSDREQPSIAAFVDPSSRDLNVEVKASSLASDDRIQIVVRGLYPKELTPKAAEPPAEDDGAPLSEEPSRDIVRGAATLYESLLGPDGSGAIAESLTIPLPSGTFDRVSVSARAVSGDGRDGPPLRVEPTVTPEAGSPTAGGGPSASFAPAAVPTVDDQGCGNLPERSSGCLVLRLAPSSVRPLMQGAWEDGKKQPVFVLDVSAHDVDYNAGVSVRIVGIRKDDSTVELYSMLLAPDPDGSVTSVARVPVAAKAKWVCAAAVVASPTNPTQDYTNLVTDGPKCPPEVKPLTAWTKSLVPRLAAATGEAEESPPAE